MVQEEYYVGTDLKFKINLNCTGFSMDTDDFCIDIYCNSKRIHYDKKDLIESQDGWYLPIDTTNLGSGTVKMVVTAAVPDPDMPNDIRREVEVLNLCVVKKVK